MFDISLCLYFVLSGLTGLNVTVCKKVISHKRAWTATQETLGTSLLMIINSGQMSFSTILNVCS